MVFTLAYRQFGFGLVLVLKKIEKIKIAACNNGGEWFSGACHGIF